MSHEINVVSKSQIIVVEPSSSSVAVINAGPAGGPQGPQGDPGQAETFVFEIMLSGPNDPAITTGTSLAVFRVPALLNGRNLSGVAAALTTVSSSGVVTTDINRSRRTNATTRSTVTMLSTKLNIDASEFDSSDATTAAVIDTTNDDVQTGDFILFDIDAAGTGAKGLVVELTFT